MEINQKIIEKDKSNNLEDENNQVPLSEYIIAKRGGSFIELIRMLF